MSKSNLKNLTTIGVAIALTGCISVNADSLDYKETKNLTLSSANISQLKINAGAGYLKISGDDSINEIEVKAIIEAVDEEFKLSLKQKGDHAILIADANPNSHSSWGINSPKIDLIVKVPSHLSLKIHDGSGEMTIHNIKRDVNIDDGSGSIEINDIGGNLEVEDGSGSMTISNVTGNIVIDDGSGSLEIEKVGGTLNIEDGSGGIDIVDVAGLVTIDDGSGSINLKKLQNGVTIIEEGSGSLKMSDIKGPVSMK